MDYRCKQYCKYVLRSESKNEKLQDELDDMYESNHFLKRDILEECKKDKINAMDLLKHDIYVVPLFIGIVQFLKRRSEYLNKIKNNKDFK